MSDEIFDTTQIKEHFDNNRTQLEVEEEKFSNSGKLFYGIVSGTLAATLFGLQYIGLNYIIFIAMIFMIYSIIKHIKATISLSHVKNINKLSEKHYFSSLTGFNGTISNMIKAIYNNEFIDLHASAIKHASMNNLNIRDAVHLVSEQFTFLSIKQIFSTFFKLDDKSILGQLFAFKQDINKTNQTVQILLDEYNVNIKEARRHFIISIVMLLLVVIDFCIFTNEYYLLLNSFITLTIGTFISIEFFKILFIFYLIDVVLFIIKSLRNHYNTTWE